MMRILFVLVVFASVASVRAQGVPVTYEARFTLTIPESWEVQHEVGFMRLVAYPPDQTGGFRSNLNVVIAGVLGGRDLESYDAYDIDQMERMIPDLTWLDRQDVRVGDLAGKQRSYTATINDHLIQGVQVVVVSEARSYTVTCTATPDAFKDFAPSCLEAARSITPG